MSVPALWTVDDMAAAMGAERQDTLPATARPLDRYAHRSARVKRSLRWRTAAMATNSFPLALAAKAALAVDRRWARVPTCRRMRRFLSCADVLAALRALAAAARARTHAKVIGVTGSVGKTTHQGSAAACAVEGRRNPRIGSFLQQSLGCAAVARALSARCALCRAGNGHEPRRRDRAAVAPRAPACGASSPLSRRCISNFSVP